MSTTTAPATVDTSAPGVPLSRLVRVEVRKAFDTRAGFWFSTSILILCAVALTFFVSFVPIEALTFKNSTGVAGGVLGYFLPIIPILLVTSEWGQRTGLVTFTLEPRRSRVVMAKFAAGVIISLAVIVVAFALAAAILGIGSVFRDGSIDWSISGHLVFNFVLSNLIGVFIGFALAMLLMNTPAAIVGYFVYSLVVPIVVGIVGGLVEWFRDLTPWIEFNTAQTPLFAGDMSPTGEQWAQIATSGFIWLVLPLTFGVLRLLRSEVK